MFALESLKRGAFIREYIYKIVTNEEEVRIMERKRGMYLMELADGLYIDAMPIGNASRFFNHSCKPNSIAHLKYVEGTPRVSIFAKQAIRVGVGELQVHKHI